ncbi:hypothetical protein FKM82_004639 [Ascaphus truei]
MGTPFSGFLHFPTMPEIYMPSCLYLLAESDPLKLCSTKRGNYTVEALPEFVGCCCNFCHFLCWRKSSADRGVDDYFNKPQSL